MWFVSHYHNIASEIENQRDGRLCFRSVRNAKSNKANEKEKENNFFSLQAHYQSNTLWQAAPVALDSTKCWRNRMWFSHNSNESSKFCLIWLQVGSHHRPELKVGYILFWSVRNQNIKRKQTNRRKALTYKSHGSTSRLIWQANDTIKWLSNWF